MKIYSRIFVLFALVFSISLVASAQTVSLSWKPSTTAGTNTYNVYRSDRLSNSADSFSKIAGGLSSTSYSDASVEYGETYAYYVTTVNGGVESAPSNVILVSVRPLSGSSEVSGSRVSAKR